MARSPCAVLVALIVLIAPGAASAQTESLESFFDRTQRLLQEQGRKIDRELRRLTAPDPRPVTGVPQAPSPPLRNPRRAAEPVPSVPRDAAAKPDPVPMAEPAQPAEPAAPPAAPPPPPHPRDIARPDWTRQEIAAAKSECDTRLAGLTVQYMPSGPIREGRCGAPYPILVSSVGADPAVEITPPARMTCAMAAALHRWLTEAVQPEALRHLGVPVVRLRNAASYVCRTRNNNPGAPMSEHGLANALDIRAFETADRQPVSVMESWGARVAAKADAEQSAAARVGGGQRLAARDAAPALPPAPSVPDETPHTKFLKAIHAGACSVFGTVLGPESDAAHRTHFHLDMAERRHGAYCR